MSGWKDMDSKIWFSYFHLKFKICLTYHERLYIPHYLQQKVWKSKYEKSLLTGRKWVRKLRLTDLIASTPSLSWFCCDKKSKLFSLLINTYIWCKISIQFKIYLNLTWDNYKSRRYLFSYIFLFFIELANLPKR